MPQDKFQDEICGFITAINQKWATVCWFDGKISEEDVAWLNKLKQEQ